MKRFGIRAAGCLGLAVALGATGCKKTGTATTDAFTEPADPASANTASVSSQSTGYPPPPQRGRVLDERENGSARQQGEQYPEDGAYGNGQGYDSAADAGQQALDEADQPPPPLPEYQQPPVTRANTIWTPGYWGHSPSGYYWVPGAWVTPPSTGALWTPGYWGAQGQHYRFHKGYWGRHVGFYGGVPYGGGYMGTGYRGGYWNGNQFNYNRDVYPVDANVLPYAYNQPERMAYPYGRVSYNGGNGGIPLLPIAAELIALHEQHQQAVRYQYDLERQAAQQRGQFYGFNHGQVENYFAPEGYVVTRGYERSEVPVLVERRPDFQGNGHAYGLYKEHGNKHFEEDGGRGKGKWHGEGQGKEDKHEGKHDEGHGNGGGHGHGKD